MRLRTVFAVLATLAALVAAPAGRADEAAIGDLEGDARILHVLNRLGYGPRPGDVDRVREEGLFPWIVNQLHPERIPDDDCERRLAGFTEFRKSATELARQYDRGTREEREAYAADLAKLAELRKRDDAPRDEIRALQRRIAAHREKTDRNAPLRELASARLVRAVHSERQLREQMVDFWFNHFNVFAGKGQSSLLIPEFEERVLRPNALGKFEDLLVAVAKSPAMLYYLDNHLSFAPPGAEVIGPGGRPVERPRRLGDRGLNENYGRELLELHTLGVDGGYTQKDVVEVARCLTGWTITSPTGRGSERTVEFEFRPVLHDAGPKVVLGKRFPGGRGIEDGMEVLRLLARHPETARFVSGKLCRKFVSDDPPPALVERCARTFLDSGGDIRLVLYRIFTSPEFLSTGAAGAKMKTPIEFAASALRAAGAETDAPRTLLAVVGRLGEPVYQCEPPTGFPDRAEEWSGSNAILARLNFATALAFGRLPGVRIDEKEMLAGAPRDAEALADWLVRRLHGRPLSPATEAAIAAAIEQAKADAGSRDRAVPLREAAGALAALVLGSPDFQMQ